MKANCFLLFLFLVQSRNLVAQHSIAGKWDAKQLVEANVGKDEMKLSEEEKNVILYMNLVRMNPQLFSETILQPYLDSLKIKENKWIKSLKKDLEATPAMNGLQFKEDLYEEALNHCLDMGKSGKTGHTTSKGKSYASRVNKLLKKYNSVFENCQYGYQDGLSIVIDLLVDEGVSNYGHRKTILNPSLSFVGASIQPHKTYRYNCVIEYGAGNSEK